MEPNSAKRFVTRQLERPDALGTLFRTAATAVLMAGSILGTSGFVASGFHLFSGAHTFQELNMHYLGSALACGLIGSLLIIERCVRGFAIINQKCGIAANKL